MRKSLVISMFIAVAFTLPCAAAVKDTVAALTALKSGVAKDRLEAVSFLVAQRSPDAYKTLAAHFPEEKDAYLRVQIVEGLDVEGSTWAYTCAVAAADDVNKSVRQAAASALASKAGDPAAAAKLKILAADASESVRFSVVNSLSVDASTSAVAIIGGMLADDKGPVKERRAAAAALSKMKTPSADTELFKHLSDADPEIKASAVSRKSESVKSSKPAKPAKPAKPLKK